MEKRKKQLKEKTQKRDEIITKIWSGSGDNLVLKIPDSVWDKKLLKIERTVKLIKVVKGDIVTKKGLLIVNL